MSLWTSKFERKVEQDLGAQGKQEKPPNIYNKEGKESRRIWGLMGYEDQKEREELSFLLQKIT